MRMVFSCRARAPSADVPRIRGRVPGGGCRSPDTRMRIRAPYYGRLNPPAAPAADRLQRRLRSDGDPTDRRLSSRTFRPE